MGQAECLKTLKKKDWLSTKEIGKIQKQSCSIINNSISRLYKQGLLKKRKVRIGWYSIYQYKLRE